MRIFGLTAGAFIFFTFKSRLLIHEAKFLHQSILVTYRFSYPLFAILGEDHNKLSGKNGAIKTIYFAVRRR